MKKLVSVLLLLCLCISLCSCGESTAVADCEALIDSIGEVTLESEDLILAARNKYDTLLIKDRGLVKNYDILLSSEAQLQSLKDAELEQKLDVLLEKFYVTEDKVEGTFFLSHIDMPQYIDTRNYLLPYIGIMDDPENMYASIIIRYNCVDSAWHFWDTLKIYIDGERFERNFESSSTERDTESFIFWEYYDEILDTNQNTSSEEITMLKKIAESEETIVRFQGNSSFADLTVTPQDKETINDVLELYSLLINE